MDECTKFHGHVCDALASCHNTVGEPEALQSICTSTHCRFLRLCVQGRLPTGWWWKELCGWDIYHFHHFIFELVSSFLHSDVDECRTGIARCDQKCINIPGRQVFLLLTRKNSIFSSYQCICERGFALSSDGLRCQDIDECSAWTGSGKRVQPGWWRDE